MSAVIPLRSDGIGLNGHECRHCGTVEQHHQSGG